MNSTEHVQALINQALKPLSEELTAMGEALRTMQKERREDFEALQTLSATVTDHFAKFTELDETVDQWADVINAQAERIVALESTVEGLVLQLNGFEVEEGYDLAAEGDEQRASRVGALHRLSELEALLKGRNRSAPMKRNMVDSDALRVMTGDAKDLGHKEAGELVGLTYAQVYSCRLEYTFKHVHKQLKADGWKNPWSKK